MLRSGISAATPAVPTAPGGAPDVRRDTAPCRGAAKLEARPVSRPDPSFWGYHLRRPMPSTRRLFTLGGAVALGLAATALFAAPASAHSAALAHDVACKDGKALVTWTVTNDYHTAATLTDVHSSAAL